jgi:hypothetical protein
MNGGLKSDVNVNNDILGFAGGTNAIFYYRNGDYSKIINALPYNWTSKELTD